MVPVANTLPELLEQLGRTFSPFERLKILTRAWALLRRMTPEERLVVATQLGLDRADEVVEALAERTGTAASPTLLSLIERAQTKGTAHLPQLIADLKDPERRAERLRQGARAAEAALVEDGTAAPWLPPAISSPESLPPPPSSPVRRAAAPVPVPEPPPPAVAAAPAPSPPPPPAPAPLPADATAPAPSPPAPAAAAPPPPAPAPRPEPPPPPADEGLAGLLAATPSLVARFRLLRDRLEGSKHPVGDLQTVLELFPDGWSRRRALAALLEEGLPEKAADAVPLLGTLSSERDRLWCLGVLAGSRGLSGADREHLLSTITSPAARRQLERRFATS
jgi:hypothetical protein